MNNENEYKRLTPFKMQVLETFPFIDADFDAITNYELLCKVVEYLNTTIDNVNILSDQVEEFQKYFDNLDVQEEINNKLDEMAEDGTLTTLISTYLNPYIANQNREISEFKAEVNSEIQTIDNKVTSISNGVNNVIDEFDSKINDIVGGSPAGVYATYDALVADTPDTDKIYLVTSNGKWYYYNTSTTTWTEGGVYQASDLNTDDKNILNKISSETIEAIYYPSITGSVLPDGTINADTGSSLRRTDYIEVRDFDAIYIVGNIGSSRNLVSYFDSNKEYISDGSILGYGAVYGRYLSIPDTAKYIIYGYYITPDVVNPYIKLFKKDSILCDVNILNNVTRNLTYKTTPTIDGFLNSSGVFNPTSNAKRTDLIPVKRFTKLRYKTNLSSAGYVIGYYDNSFNLLTGVSILGNGAVEDTVNIPETAYYVVLSNYGTTVENPYLLLFNEESAYNISNKNILIFGDSISDCNNITINSDNETSAYSWKNPSNSYVKDGQTISYSMWPKLLNMNYGCKEVRNYSKSGASYKYQTRTSGNERQNVSYQIEVAINDKNNPNNVFNQNSFTPDIVIFALGTNDGLSNDTYESAMAKTIYVSNSDTIDVTATLNNLDLTKFNESVRYCMLKVKKEWPMAQIFVVLPIQRADRETLDTNNQLEKMSLRYGATIINGSGNAGITREFDVVDGLGTYLKDGLHPNEKGQNLLTRLIVTSLFSNYIDFSKMN